VESRTSCQIACTITAYAGATERTALPYWVTGTFTNHPPRDGSHPGLTRYALLREFQAFLTRVADAFPTRKPVSPQGNSETNCDHDKALLGRFRKGGLVTWLAAVRVGADPRQGGPEFVRCAVWPEHPDLAGGVVEHNPPVSFVDSGVVVAAKT
jgi:hypothetical protein